MGNHAWLRAAGCMVTMALLGCGDAETNDQRGYTKAPLEEAGILIKAEGSSDMDALGSPNLPRDTIIPAQQAAPASTTR